VFIAAAAEILPQPVPPAPTVLMVFYGVVLVLIPLAIIIFARMLLRVERDGPRTRPDLFALPDMLAMGVVFTLMAMLILNTRLTAVIQPPSAVTPGPTDAMTARLLLQGMLSASLPSIGLLAVVLMRGGRLQDIFGLGKVPIVRAVVLGIGLGILAFALATGVRLFVGYFAGNAEAPQKLVQEFRDAAKGSNTTLIMAITLSATVVAPLNEEILFRGMFYPGFARILGRGPSALLMAIAFALVHDTLIDAPSLAMLALCLTLAYEVTGSLLVPIFMHAMFNGISLFVMWYCVKAGLPVQ
jgi:membrane protease YdiL (CAAX protease family)